MLGYSYGQSDYPAPADTSSDVYRHRGAFVWRRDRYSSEGGTEFGRSSPWRRSSRRQRVCDLVGKVRDALNDTYSRYPFIAYGTDWLAFGHFVIALAIRVCLLLE